MTWDPFWRHRWILARNMVPKYGILWEWRLTVYGFQNFSPALWAVFILQMASWEVQMFQFLPWLVGHLLRCLRMLPSWGHWYLLLASAKSLDVSVDTPVCITHSVVWVYSPGATTDLYHVDVHSAPVVKASPLSTVLASIHVENQSMVNVRFPVDSVWLRQPVFLFSCCFNWALQCILKFESVSSVALFLKCLLSIYIPLDSRTVRLLGYAEDYDIWHTSFVLYKVCS